MIANLASALRNGAALVGVVYLLATLAALALVVLTSLFTYRMARAGLRFRGRRVVRCPETHDFAAVKVDASHAALTAAVGDPLLRLNACSRWPERKDCGQECLCEIEAAPEATLLRNVVARWYEGKRCFFCHADLAVTLLDHEPALLSPDGKTWQWDEIAAEKIPAALETHFPVCWNCHIALWFQREHPELVVYRRWPPEGPCGERRAAVISAQSKAEHMAGSASRSRTSPGESD